MRIWRTFNNVTRLFCYGLWDGVYVLIETAFLLVSIWDALGVRSVPDRETNSRRLSHVPADPVGVPAVEPDETPLVGGNPRAA